MKSKFKAAHKITTLQLNKQKSQKNSPLCAVYSPLCTQCMTYEVRNISNNINIVIWNNKEGHQTKFRFFEQNFIFWFGLVRRFNNRWRWCRGHFNFRQITLLLGYLRSFFFQFFPQCLDFDFQTTLGCSKLKMFCVFTEL